MSSSIYVSAQTRNCCTQAASSDDGTMITSVTRCSSGSQTSTNNTEYISNCLQAESDLERILAVLTDEEQP